MEGLVYAAGFVLVVVAAVVWFQWQLKKKRDLVRQREFPQVWRGILKENFPLYLKLPPDFQTKLEELIHLFLYEKSFEGCRGLVIDDEIRVTIAAQACLLVLNNHQELYPKLQTILVYPSTYKTNNRESMFHFMEEDAEARLGESWSTGSVVLAWDSVLAGGTRSRDGHNVTFHEFAHQLDQLDGHGDGAPRLKDRSRYASWARVLSREYDDLVEKSERGRKSFFNEYGATEPAEFFAVVTETFFERPKKMKAKHPELYEEFKTFYNLDPCNWQTK
jgi:Mlc titration factor MtfA (ptsG expression regulator)